MSLVGSSHWRAYLDIARFDHWVKNVFVLPGVIVGLAMGDVAPSVRLGQRLVVGLFAIGLVASSNYVLNEVLDGPFDALHPVKKLRPVPSGRVNVKLAYSWWLLLGAVGLAMASWCGTPLMAICLALLVMGCVYNIQPLRTKDVPYLDVLSEAVNNPLRMLAGWFIVAPNAFAPGSLLASYWMIGCYFMAIKRFAELRLVDGQSLVQYRAVFAHYTEQRLLVSIVFYASTATLFLGAFVMRYRLELVLSFPFVAWVMAVYLSIAFKPNSAAQAPERLYREPKLMFAVATCTAVMISLFFLPLPWLADVLAPTAPVAEWR